LNAAAGLDPISPPSLGFGGGLVLVDQAVLSSREDVRCEVSVECDERGG
jgi:hypothetical protein